MQNILKKTESFWWPTWSGSRSTGTGYTNRKCLKCSATLLTTYKYKTVLNAQQQHEYLENHKKCQEIIT